MPKSSRAVLGLVATLTLSAVLAMSAGAQAPKPAPDFDLPALGSGPNVKLSTLKGTPVVLLFWAAH